MLRTDRVIIRFVKNMYKEACSKSLHWSFHGLRAHPYSHIAILL